jgi:hypothetical protein
MGHATMAKIIIIVFAACAVAYPLVMRLIATKMQPYRLALAAHGNELLLSDVLSGEQKTILRSMLEDAFNWRVMIIAFVCIPVVVVMQMMSFAAAHPPRAASADRDILGA